MPTMAQTKRQRPANKTTPAIATTILTSLSEAASPPPPLASSLQEAAPKEGKTESGGLRNKAFVGEWEQISRSSIAVHSRIVQVATRNSDTLPVK